MKKLFWITIVIALLAAFFASANPDGLDFVANQLGFAQKGVERQAPLTNYSIKLLPDGQFSTLLAGIIGIVIVLAIFRLVVYVLEPRLLVSGSKTKRQVPFCLLILTLVLTSPTFAARPLVTDDFYTVAQGGYELEFGYGTTQNQASLVNSTNLSFKRGFLPTFDFGIEIPYTTSSPSGLNDIYLHAKYRFLEKNPDEGLTARVDYKFRNADVNQGLGSGDNDYCCMIIGTKMFGQTKTHLNIGYVNVGVNAGVQSDDYIAYTCALEHPLWGEKGDLVAEYVANNAAAPNPAFIQIGARYVIHSGFKLDAGYSFGLNKNSIKNNLTAGLHCEF